MRKNFRKSKINTIAVFPDIKTKYRNHSEKDV